MDSPPTPLDTPPAPAAKSGKRTGKPSFIEDLLVTGFGFATSTAVAWLSWWMASHWDIAVYTWMANMVIPIGAIICGFVAAIGYWIGARWFNHRPTKVLMFNIVLVSISTFFAIHHFHYTNDKVSGMRISRNMTYPDYLVAVTEHMTYKTSGSSTEGTELGKWGWGVAALQVIGFSFGGFAVYSMLCAVPYCDGCSKYLNKRTSALKKWKDPAEMHAAFETVSGLINQEHYQEAINTFAGTGEKRRIGTKATLHLDLRKCPDCDLCRLSLTANQKVSRKWQVVGQNSRVLHQPLTMG